MPFRTIIEFFLPYNNFIVLLSLIILNIFLMARRSYWQSYLIGNGFLLAVLLIFGFDPTKTFTDVIRTLIEFIIDILEQLADIIF